MSDYENVTPMYHVIALVTQKHPSPFSNVKAPSKH